MDVVIKIAQFVVSFSLLVIIHELGHYMFARMFGIRVEKFYLFFNPWFSLVKFKYKDTEYGIGWIPFGGYVKIAGMIDESMDAESMRRPPRPDEFRSKPAWQRLLVMVGGVTMNIVLALCIYIGVTFAWGERYIANDDLKAGSAFNSLAMEIGFCNGDRIMSVGGERYEDYGDIYKAMVMELAPDVEVLRDGKPQTVEIDDKYLPQMLESPDFMMPRVAFVVGKVVKGGPAAAAGVRTGDRFIALDGVPMEYHDQFAAALSEKASQTVTLTAIRKTAAGEKPVDMTVAVDADGKIGILNSGYQWLPVRSTRHTFFESVPKGFRRTGSEIVSYWKQLRMILSPKTEAYKSLGGVIAIGSIFPGFWDWQVFWTLTAFLSIVLAIMNIIPLPALDGGHVMFLLYEVATGRKPSDKFLETAQGVGLLILVAVLLLANGNDIYRFFIK